MSKLIGITVLLSLVGCTQDKALVITGETTIHLADQFVLTAGVMDAALENKTITPAQYQAWTIFGKKFQLAYPMAVSLWRLASDSQDPKMLADMVKVITDLANDLAKFTEAK